MLERTTPMRPRVILLDVYETLLDMSEIERRVNGIMDSKRGYMIWFELFMQYCFVDNCTSRFNDFTAIAKATLKMSANIMNRQVTDDAIDDLIDRLKHLPIKENVQEGLSLLSEQQFRIAALTNSSEKIVRERMNLTGLVSYFDMVLSAEKIKKYKPCLEVYEWAAAQLSESPEHIMLVSAHSWDVSGAAYANMQTAYINKSRQILYPLAPAPQIIAKDLVDLSEKLQVVAKSV